MGIRSIFLWLLNTLTRFEISFFFYMGETKNNKVISLVFAWKPLEQIEPGVIIKGILQDSDTWKCPKAGNIIQNIVFLIKIRNYEHN